MVRIPNSFTLYLLVYNTGHRKLGLHLSIKVYDENSFIYIGGGRQPKMTSILPALWLAQVQGQSIISVGLVGLSKYHPPFGLLHPAAEAAGGIS